MTKNNSKILKSAFYGILVTSTMTCIFPNHSQAMEETFKSSVKCIQKFPDRINSVKDTLIDVTDDLGTAMYRTFEEEEPKNLIDKVNQTLNHKVEDLEKRLFVIFQCLSQSFLRNYFLNNITIPNFN